MLNDLAQLVRDYLDGHKNRSLKRLSMRTGVAYATLRRILLQNTVPNMESILPLIQFICSKEQGVAFLKTHFSSFGIWLEEYFSGDQDFADANMNHLIKDKENFVIISLAATDSGTTRENVHELLGVIGGQKINNLIDHGILVEEQGRLRTTKKEFGCVDPDSVLAQIKNAAEIFNKDRLRSSTAMAGIQTDGVSEEGLKEIFKVMVDAEMKVSKIRKKYRGNHTMFAGLILNAIEA